MIKAEDQERIIKALSDKGGVKPCSVCGNANFTTGPGFVTVMVTEDPMKVALSGEAMPLVPFICSNCGNTVFVNLFVLGLGDLIQQPEPPEAHAADPAQPDGPPAAAS